MGASSKKEDSSILKSASPEGKESTPFEEDAAILNRQPIIINETDWISPLRQNQLYQAAAMIDKDSRLDAPDKDVVISKVKKRLHDVGTNGLTLGDVVKEEADKQVAANAKALSIPIQMDAEAGKRILSWHFRNVVSQDCSDSAKSDLKSLPKNPTEAEVVAAVKAIPKDRLDDVVYRDNTTVIKIRSQLEHISIITPYRSVQDAISAKLSE